MKHDIAGKWYNQHHSEIELDVDADGRIRGTFRSGVGFPESAESFELAGFVSDDLVGFTVSFGRYDSMTSWTGHYRADEESLECLWHMSVGVPGSAEELWKGIWSGADTFRRERGAEPAPGRTMRSHPVPATIRRTS